METSNTLHNLTAVEDCLKTLTAVPNRAQSRRGSFTGWLSRGQQPSNRQRHFHISSSILNQGCNSLTQAVAPLNRPKQTWIKWMAALTGGDNLNRVETPSNNSLQRQRPSQTIQTVHDSHEKISSSPKTVTSSKRQRRTVHSSRWQPQEDKLHPQHSPLKQRQFPHS